MCVEKILASFRTLRRRHGNTPQAPERKSTRLSSGAGWTSGGCTWSDRNARGRRLNSSAGDSGLPAPQDVSKTVVLGAPRVPVRELHTLKLANRF